MEYCNKRSIREGLAPCYRGSGDSIVCDWTANGYRLPTEAEWDYAAKGGKNQQYLTYLYSGSNNADAVAWYDDNSDERTHEVGTKHTNRLGIYDMSGNVREWCWDWYGGYPSEAQNNPTGPSSGSFRDFRGGGWSSVVSGVRAFFVSGRQRYVGLPHPSGFPSRAERGVRNDE